MEYLLGVVVSLIVQGIKKYFETDIFLTYVILLAVSLIGGSVYVWLVTAGLWEVTFKVLLAAAAFHNLLIRRFEA